MMESVLLWEPSSREFREIPFDTFDREPWFFYAGESAYWPLRAEDREHLEFLMAMSPGTRVAIGPVIRGPRDNRPAGLYLEDWGALVSMCGNDPFEALAHELFHAIFFETLSDEERFLLEVHGDLIRKAYKYSDDAIARWLRRDGEAEAHAFDCWRSGQPLPVKPPVAVVEIWKAIAAGRYAA